MILQHLKENDLFPNFELQSSSGMMVNNENTLGKKILFFIYPKDNTSSCTKEAQDFSDNKKVFNNLGVELFGVSKDSILSHNKFIKKNSLKLELLSDENLTFITSVGAWVEKVMYGRKYMGVQRTSLLIDSDGTLIKIWRKVRVVGHVSKVLLFVSQNFK